LASLAEGTKKGFPKTTISALPPPIHLRFHCKQALRQETRARKSKVKSLL